MSDGRPQSIPFLIVLSGPSGAGKSSVTRVLLERNRDLHYSVSMTTRPIRPAERDGADYHFTTEAEFRRRVEADEMIEWAVVHGAHYGTPRTPILEAFRRKQSVLLDIDVQGARQIREGFDRGIFVFLLPPSYRVLAERLRGRGTDADDVIDRRLRQACREIAELRRYDYLVINEFLEDAVERVEEIIRVEGRRVERLRGIEAWIRAFRPGGGESDGRAG